MATRSSILAWRIPWTEEPGRLQSVGSRVGHDYACPHTSFSEPFLLCLLFSLLQGETHTLPLAHTHTLTILLLVSVSLSTVLPNMHTLCLLHTLSHHFCCVLCRSASTRKKKNFSASGSSKMACGTKRDPSVVAT